MIREPEYLREGILELWVMEAECKQNANGSDVRFTAQVTRMKALQSLKMWSVI